ncbi:MAG TPA: S49 family peptidase [Methylocystis sp.]|jgi:ClpP class serine protease
MNFAREELVGRLFNTPLALDAGKAAAIVEALGPRLLGEDKVIVVNAESVDHKAFANGRPSAGRLGDRTGRSYDRDRAPVYDMVGNVAVIPIEGSLVHKGNYVGASSGRTSYQGLQAQIIRAARDPQVVGAVFEVDSFGGEVAGLFETAAMIADLSKIKPTLSILTDHALSAGYALASAARQIVMPAHGSIGSIGAIALHADMSGALEKKGVKVTVLRAGKRKAESNPYESLSDEAAASELAALERIRVSFAAAVGRHRGARFNADQAMATEAASFDGADAVALGLADAVGHANSAFDQFVRELAR